MLTMWRLSRLLESQLERGYPFAIVFKVFLKNSLEEYVRLGWMPEVGLGLAWFSCASFDE